MSCMSRTSQITTFPSISFGSLGLALVLVAGVGALAGGLRPTAPAEVVASPSSVQDQILGERLEREMWKAMATSDMDRVAAMIAPGFQSVHADGARDRSEELSLISNLELGPYTLSDFTVTRQGAAIVVCYFVEVAETIASQRIERKAARSSVWLMTRDGWQWVHHANIAPMQIAPQGPAMKAAPAAGGDSRNPSGR